MADNDVKMTFFANGAAAERALVLLEKKYGDLENKVKQVARTSKKASDDTVKATDAARKSLQSSLATNVSLTNSFQGLMKSASPMVAVFATLGAAAAGAAQKNREYAASIDAAARRHSESDLKLRIQGGFTPAQTAQQSKVIRAALLETPSMSIEEAYATATQLASSGFNPDDVASGAAFRTVLKIAAAGNQWGRGAEDSKTAVKAAGQFLKATGSPAPTAAEIGELGAKLIQLKGMSDIEFPALAQLAVESAGLTAAGLSRDEQKAAFAALGDIIGDSQAATGLRQFVSKSRSAGARKDAAKGLKAVGLNPEDIDFKGENFGEVLDRWGKALAGADQVTGFQSLVKVYGEEAAGNIQTLVQLRSVYGEYLSGISGDAFAKNVEAFEKSRFASRERGRLRGDFAARDLDLESGELTWEEVAERRRSSHLESRRGATAFQRFGMSLQEHAGSWWDWIQQSMGRTPEEAGYASPRVQAGQNAALYALEQIERNTRGQVNRNANGEGSR